MIRLPSFQSPRWVLARLSPETSTANQSGPFSTTVRQQPEQAIEAPMAIGAMSCRVRTTKRRSPLLPPGVTEVISPMSLTMPVNMTLNYAPLVQLSTVSPCNERAETSRNRGAKSSRLKPSSPTAERPSAPRTTPAR